MKKRWNWLPVNGEISVWKHKDLNQIVISKHHVPVGPCLNGLSAGERLKDLDLI